MVREIMRSFALPGPLTTMIALATIFLTGVGMFSISRKKPLLPVLIILHITITLAVLLALSMRIWPRFFFVDIGFVLLFITQGVFVCCQQIALYLSKITRLRIKANGLFLASSTLMIVISCILLIRNYQFPKQGFESSIQYIMERKSQHDEIRTLGRAEAPFNKYYQQQWPAIESEEDLRSLNHAATTTWLVIIFPNRTRRKYDGIMRYVQSNYSLTKTFRGTLGDGNILIFKSNSLD